MPRNSSKSNKSRKSSSTSKSRNKFEVLQIIAIVLIALGVGFLGGHRYLGSSHAQFTSKVCNGQGWCLNRSGNGYLDGTHVLAWPSGANENFVMIAANVPGCGSFVQNNSKKQCPFTVGSGLNARYVGDPINEMLTDTTSTSANKCVGTDSVGKAILLPCDTGAGVYMIAHDGYFVDRYWSNVNYQTYHEYNTPSYFCGFFYQKQAQFSNSAQSGYCTWQIK